MLIVSVSINGCGNPGMHKSSSIHENSLARKGPSSHESRKTYKVSALAEKAEKFIKGKTTFDEVVSELGEPLRVSDFNDGKWVDYEGYTTPPQGKEREYILHMRFDKYKVLYLKVVN